MSDPEGNDDDQLDDILTELEGEFNEDNSGSEDNTGEPESPESEGGDDEKLSKEEIAEKFDVQFAKSRASDTQHLVQAGRDNVACGAFSDSDFKQSDSPGPFDPVCKVCRMRIQGKTRSSPRQTLDELRDWLADEIDGVEESSQGMQYRSLTKSETAAVIDYIKQLKERLNQNN